MLWDTNREAVKWSMPISACDMGGRSDHKYEGPWVTEEDGRKLNMLGYTAKQTLAPMDTCHRT